MADIVVPIAQAVRAKSGVVAPVTVTPLAIATAESFELDLDSIPGDAFVIILEKADSNAITITVDSPAPDGFSHENLALPAQVTPAAAGQFMFGPFDTAQVKHNSDAGADAGKLTGVTAGTLTTGTIIAIALPKGVG